MKTLRLCALLCAMTIWLSGCQFLSPSTDRLPTEEYHDPHKYIDEFRNNLQYGQLSETAKHGYGQIYTAIRDSEMVRSHITDTDGRQCAGVRVPLSDIRFTSKEMAHLFETFFRDNPRFFYLDRTYGLEGYESNGTTVYDTLLLQFTMDVDERVQAINRLQQTVSAILSERPITDDDYDLELYLHDRILSNCLYDDQAATASSGEYANAYSAYGALVEGKAVCEGYAKAMQLLLNTVSIPATVVLGNAAEDNEPHMWNLVNINGHYYYLDPTWNDDDAYVQYTYFNITTDMLLRTHIPEADAFTVECTTLEDNYHIRNNTYIDTYERDVIAQTIATRILAGDTNIHLRFADGKYENALLFLKNATLTQKTVNKHLGKQTMWDYELRTQANQGSIFIHKK